MRHLWTHGAYNDKYKILLTFFMTCHIISTLCSQKNRVTREYKGDDSRKDTIYKEGRGGGGRQGSDSPKKKKSESWSLFHVPPPPCMSPYLRIKVIKTYVMFGSRPAVTVTY